MSVDRQVQTEDTHKDILVRPNEQFKTLLQDAGATKDVFTMKEVMFYLGEYIFQRELYDQKQQHIIHCSQDPLGRVFGVDSFSATDPIVLPAIVNKNLVAVRSHDLSGSQSNRQTDRGAEEADSESCSSSPDRRRKRKSRWAIGSSEPGPDDDATEDESDEEEEDADKKRRRFDRFSPTSNKETAGVTQYFPIGGEGRGRDRHSSRSSDSGNTVCEDTVLDEEEDESLDEDTEEYWQCLMCEVFNPPISRQCIYCWTLREHWLSEDEPTSFCLCPKAPPTKPTDQSEAKETPAILQRQAFQIPLCGFNRL